MSHKRLFWVQWIVIFVICFLVISSLLLLYSNLFLGGDNELKHPVPQNVSISSYATQFAQNWQSSVFLTDYSVTYRFLQDGSSQNPIAYGETVFNFAGRRRDILQTVAERFDVYHLFASVTVDNEQRQIIRFKHSQGTPIGYDAPLKPESWPINDIELIQLCDTYGGDNFRISHDIELAHVAAASRKLGREWSLVYNSSPHFFRCLVNIDTGQISVRDDVNDWQQVGVWKN